MVISKSSPVCSGLRPATDNPAAQDHSARPISFEPNSETVFSFLEEQLDQCLNVHVPAGSCQFQTGSRPPRRLLHIQREAGQPHLKLVEPAEGALLKWCALSYCWGNEGTSMTTRATLQSRLMSVKFDELPRTLREAILVCQRLNVSYIWIDSLCIVQDDEEEKMHDVKHMPDVYGQAFITLSASSASSVNKGFLHTRDIAMRFPPFSLRYRCRDGAEGRLLFQPELYPKRDPTNRRGWTLQERVLSPRLIDFSSLQVRWRCQTTKSCDSGYPPSQWKWYFHATDYISRASLQHMSTDDVIYLCKTLVEDYSQRQVTFPEDKLVAFSAIPTLLNRDGGYYAGLWAADFPFNLTWAPNGSPGGHLPPRPRKYRAPSWSWAALDVEVYFPCFIFLRPRDHCKVHAKVLECESKPLHPDAPFGAISSAYLKIRGRFAQAKWYFNLQADDRSSQVRLAVGCRAKNSRGLLQGKHDATEEGWPSTPEAHADVLCLLVVETFLKASGLLLMNEDSGAGFRRVGHWESQMADVAEFAGPHSIWLV